MGTPMKHGVSSVRWLRCVVCVWQACQNKPSQVQQLLLCGDDALAKYHIFIVTMMTMIVIACWHFWRRLERMGLSAT